MLSNYFLLIKYNSELSESKNWRGNEKSDQLISCLGRFTSHPTKLSMQPTNLGPVLTLLDAKVSDRFALLQVVDVDHTLWIPKNGGHHLCGRWDSLSLLQSRFAGWSPLFRLFLALWCVPVDPCFVDGHETMQKLLRIALKQRQTLLWSGLTVAFVVRRFLMPKFYCRIWPTRSFDMPTVSAI